MTGRRMIVGTAPEPPLAAFHLAIGEIVGGVGDDNALGVGED